MKIIGIIPARFKSSRLPGKPLADIHGKPMVWHVYHQAIKAKMLDEVYIATDDKRIKEVCDDFNMKVLMTSDAHKTGSDRLSECVSKISEIYKGMSQW
jgi:3-deoxy-manno-octulosonate cytidylyltransferase (CMP-KDO synthetase)